MDPKTRLFVTRRLPLLIALLLVVAAAVGRWFLPSVVHDRYAQRLADELVRFKKLESVQSPEAASNVVQSASEINILFERLVLIERGMPQRLWEWADFQRRVIESVSSGIASSNRNTEEINALAEVLTHYRSQSTEVLRQLANGKSEQKVAAIFQLTDLALRDCITTGNVVGAEEALKNLQQVISDSAFSEMHEVARLRMAELHYYRAWGRWDGRPFSPLQFDVTEMKLARELLPMQPFGDSALACRQFALRTLLDLFDQAAEWEKPTADLSQYLKESGEASGNDFDPFYRLAQLSILAERGSWQELGFLLTRNNTSDNVLVATGISRTICWMALSNRAKNDPAWTEDYLSAVELALRSAPQIADMYELFWVAGSQLASQATEAESKAEPLLPSGVVALFRRNDHPFLKSNVIAIAFANANQASKVREQLQVLAQSNGTINVVVRAAFQQIEMGDSKRWGPSATLLRECVAVDPANGLAQFAAGVASLKLELPEEAVGYLNEAEKILGQSPAVSSTLTEAKRRLKAASSSGENE